MKLLVIDGNSIVNRAFYGIKLLTTKDGRYTNGIYGFINILNHLKAAENPDGIVVAFDVHAKTFRHEMYAEYKAGRKGMPEELKSQIPLLKEWLDLAGYSRIELPGFEADDILGTMAELCENQGAECVIATGDRDSLQLVSNTTRVLLTATKMGRPETVNYNKQALFEKYGLEPCQMIELKALQGDASDNIPGVPGVGEKTASDLITRFGSVEGVYKNIDSPDIKEGVRQKLISGRESAALSRKLGTIKRDVPINTDLSEYLIKPVNEPDLVRFMAGLELFKLIENMGLSAVNVAVPEAETGAECFAENKDVLSAQNVDIYADYTAGDFVFCSGNGYFKVNIKDFDVLKTALQKGSEKRVYNAKALYKFCKTNGIELKGVVFDSMLAAYLCSPAASNYELIRLAGEYFVPMPNTGTVSDTAVIAACLNTGVCNKLFAELESKNQLKLLADIELPLAEVLAEMELTGFLLDKAGIENYGKELNGKIAEISAEIFNLAGYEFNLNSPKQLGVALFEKMGLPAKKKTKSGYSTSNDVLEDLRHEYPVVDLILNYRALAKLKSTYCDGLSALVSADGRIRTTFNQTETRTGRISSLEPNLQNIPVRRPEGRKMREFFIAPKGYVLCDADYSQIELRVLAHMAGDEAMINAFNSGVDIHTATAASAFNMPIEMVTPEMRSRAKAVNFGIVYGIGAFSLSRDIGVSVREAKEYINNYLAAFKNVDKYMQTTINEARQNGYVLTLFGRRRYLPELSASNAAIRAFGERVARNAPIQGTAADIIKIAMVKVYNRLKKECPEARLILQVHDELIAECPENKKETVCRILEEEMRASAKLSVELSVDAHSGNTWFGAKG